MENSALNQLPEVDSLPDGFVESSGESIAPVTPLNEREQKPLVDEFKDKLFVESVVVTNNEGSSGNGLGFADGKLPKLRTFPVPLSENKEGHDDDDDDHGFCNNELKEDRGVMMGRGVASDCASTASVDCGNEKDQSDAERSKKGEPDAESTHAKGKQVSESQKNGKETVEVKRKSSKRTFKTEQEFLEFTLKYKQVLAERDAAIAVRDKLESLCRELQRQNKLLMDECKKVSEEGQNLRLDLSTRFQDAIKDVSIKLDEQKEDCLSQLKENEMLRDKLKQLADQYTLAQQQFAQELKQKTLELKIAELKVQQAEEKLAHEQVQMKQYAEKISQLLETEKSLRLQLTADGEKFQQFQDALLKSNEVFETFKQEIEKMAKLTKELKRENTFLKSKCEKSDYTLIELVEERERMKKQLEKTKNQKEKLESLCRSLQAERKQSSNGTSQIEPVQQQD